ncbi:hypothetical protein BH11PSE11_BH11PSE11_34820 [soil metagenome]
MTNDSRSQAGKFAWLAGGVALLAACIPCCLPLAAPILAWLGIASLGAVATGWYVAGMGVSALGVAAILYARSRRGASCGTREGESGCDCGTACKT